MKYLPIIALLTLVVCAAAAGCTSSGNGDGSSGNDGYPFPIHLMRTGQAFEESVTSGDGGDLQMGVAWPKPRFTDNDNGTITGNLTCLM